MLERFYDDPLAQARYLVGCAATGEALVIDANRDVAQHLRAVEAEQLRVAEAPRHFSMVGRDPVEVAWQS